MAVSSELRDGVEVRVETGTGILKLADGTTPSSRNAKVEITTTHRQLDFPVKGWVDTRDAELWTKTLEAHNGRFEVSYRIEVAPNRDAPAGVALDKLTAKQKLRALVELARPAIDGQTAPEPTRAPKSPPPTPAPDDAPRFGPEGEALNTAAADVLEAREEEERKTSAHEDLGRPMTAEDRKGLDVARARELRAELEAREQGSGPAPKPPQEPVSAALGARMSTYAYQDASALAGWAWELVTAQGQGPNPARSKTLAGMLLEVVDRSQTATFGRVDRNDYSRPRVRGALRHALDSHPVPWGSSPEEKGRWKDELVGATVGILRLALDLLDT